MKANQFTAIITLDGEIIERATQAQMDEHEGTGSNTITVTAISERKFNLALDCYYDAEGEFELTITNKLDVALKIFAAALKCDAELEFK